MSKKNSPSRAARRAAQRAQIASISSARCVSDPSRACPRRPLRCRPGDLAIVVNTTGGGHKPYPNGLVAWVDFTPLLGRIVRVVKLDPEYAPCVPVWFLESPITLPDIYGEPCVIASLPDARLRPLRAEGIAEEADWKEGDVAPIAPETTPLPACHA